jgi:rubrerythrin
MERALMSNSRQKPTDVGLNRTGMGTAPIQSKKMLKGVDTFEPSTADGRRLEAVRVELSRSAPPMGTMPPPPTMKGALKTAMAAVKGEAPVLFLDRLGERLAFERTGFRLYQALLVKWEAASTHEGGPTREELEKIRDQELRHFAILEQAVERMGADPTVVTPSADVAAVSSSGLLQLLGDSRATFTQCLSAILMAELTDNDAWRTLVELARALGHEDWYQEFSTALAEEEEHLALVRRWVANAIFRQAGVAPPSPTAQPPAL